MSYDDSAWGSGNGILGFGETFLATTITNHNRFTYYFRKTFEISQDIATITSLTLQATYDDGFVCYINGQEVARKSMPSGAYTYSTAGSNHGSSQVYETIDLTAQIGKLVQGTNIIAIDVHNRATTSSDVVWDAALTYTIGQQSPTNTPVPTTSTGYLSPSANAAVTSSAGDNNGYQTNPTNAYNNNSVFAVDTNSGSGTSTSYTSTQKDKHLFYNYNFSIPTSAVIQGIQVRLDARRCYQRFPKIYVQFSWDGGVSWTTGLATTNLTTSEVTYTLGGTGNTSGTHLERGELLQCQLPCARD